MAWNQTLSLMRARVGSALRPRQLAFPSAHIPTLEQMNNPTSVHLHITIPASVHRALKVRAATEGTTISALVNAALSSSKDAPAPIVAAPPPLARTREEEQPLSIVGRVMASREP
jgi:hypothetical protein